jgi:hypothetical protein
MPGMNLELLGVIGTGELWGNFPQTYRVGIVSCAVRLSRSREDLV